MDDIILKTDNLCKQYGNFLALDHVNISLHKGHIYGFIGENGAGKSTLMKLLTGLCFPTSGTITIFGESSEKGLMKVRSKIGSMIEAPALHSEYTVYENVNMQRILAKNPDKDDCDKVLSLVGLSDVSNRKARKLSMGMKQRLSLAMALVCKPQFLVLDEPINGLDPQNIVQFRKIIEKLNKENDMTILISSHILSELYLLATDYIIIHKGKIVKCITHEELANHCRKCLRIKMSDVPKGLVALEKGLKTKDFKVDADDIVYLYSHLDDVEKVAKILSKNDILVTELSLTEDSLENYFFSVIGGEA